VLHELLKKEIVRSGPYEIRSCNEASLYNFKCTEFREFPLMKDLYNRYTVPLNISVHTLPTHLEEVLQTHAAVSTFSYVLSFVMIS
jgi:hypothetical protein